MCTVHTHTGQWKFCTVFPTFLFFKLETVIWCAGQNRDFIIILIHYFLTNRVYTMQSCVLLTFCLVGIGSLLRIQGIENQKCSREKGFIIHIDTNSVHEWLWNLISCLHNKLQLISMKNKKLGNSAQYALHCAVSVCTLLTLFVKIAI
jgi:hypothetical protein